MPQRQQTFPKRLKMSVCAVRFNRILQKGLSDCAKIGRNTSGLRLECARSLAVMALLQIVMVTSAAGLTGG